MYHPTLEEVRKLKKQGNMVPVYREIKADLDTPVSAYLKIARGQYSFLLESVEGGERLARYSFLGTEPSMIIESGKTNDTMNPLQLNPLPRRGEETGEGREVNGKEADYRDPLIAIEELFKKYKPVHVEGLPRFHGGMVGYLGYEVARYFEKLPSPEGDALGVPESVLMLADTLLIFDHIAHTIKVVSHAYLDGDVDRAYKAATDNIDRLAARLNKPVPAEEKIPMAPTPSPRIESNRTQAEYEHMVTRAKEYIYDGDILQIVPSQRLARRTNADPFAIYRALRSINPSPYMYFLNLGNFHIVGASPELLVRVEDGIVSNHPIAGTRARGVNPDIDKALAEELKHDEKECAEHVMLVDLARNDVGRISEPGTVKVTQFMDIERYSHVMHLVSHIQGNLKKGMTQFDAMRACFPAGTVSGAPKIRAMEIIAELEPDKRGPYAGAVGYFDFSGNMDTAIAIRTIVIKDGTAYVQAGGGVVADSVPATEYQESLNKAQASLSAIDQAEAG